MRHNIKRAKRSKHKIKDRLFSIYSSLAKSIINKNHADPQRETATATRTMYRQDLSARRSIRVKNKKKLLWAAGMFIFVVLAAAFILILNGRPPKIAAAGIVSAVDDRDAGADNTDSGIVPATSSEIYFSLAVPVYNEVSISEGMDAQVVEELQSRLMQLDYMGADEPGSIFEETTKLAVQHFQEQHGLGVTGIVDRETYELLMSKDAQVYTIAIGTENTDVSELQQRLYELGYISKTTGYFGTDTEAAVKKFQKLNGLSEDGKVGRETREMLYSGSAAANSYSYGEQSPEILSYQQRLKKLGYLTTEPDGNFGEDTKTAVKRFQESSGLIADGYIGPATKEALMSKNAQGNALSIGAKGSDVTNLQERLKKLGYIKKATGYFGSDTDTAVRSFQKTNGLTVDGKVGAITMNRLMSSSAKKFTGASVTGANIESLISVAQSKIGSKYVLGAKGPDRFDCSGFVYWCLNKVGVKQSYMTSRAWAASSKYTKITKMSSMKRGDIIVFKGHVGIYAGNGIMIDASSSNGKVVKRGCTSSWSKSNFICAFRIF